MGYAIAGNKSFFYVLEGVSTPLNLREIVDTEGILNLSLGSKCLDWSQLLIYPGTVVMNSNIRFVEDEEEGEEDDEEEARGEYTRA